MMKGMRGNEPTVFCLFFNNFVFRILSDNPELLEDPEDKDSECDPSDEDNEDGDDSNIEDEGSCNAADCNNDAPRTLDRFRKRRQIV
jgi:hypothetical protein